MGEKITHLAAEYGAERTAVIHRLKRRFPEEYAKLSAAGLITCAPSEKALKARSAKLDEKWANDPAVLEYLHGNGNGNGTASGTASVTIQQVADRYNISYSTLWERVQRALRHINREKNKHDQTNNRQSASPGQD